MTIKRTLASLFSRPIWWTLHNYKVLSVEFAQFRTIRRRECVDKNDNPIPWYSYPAIEYLKQLDLKDRTVFEYGSGNSTLFWASRCKSVVSVEDSEEWYKKLVERVPTNVDYLLLTEKHEYVRAIERYSLQFDIIVVDGSHRFDCATVARPRLRDDGLFILDNSDWLERTSQFLRDSDLIEVDMSGFGPINPYTWTTSFYFTRNVRLQPLHDRQPKPGIGSVHQSETESHG